MLSLTPITAVALRTARAGDDPLLRALFAADRPPVLLEEQYAAREAAYSAAWPTREDRVIEVADRAVGRVLVGMAGRKWRLVDLAVLPEHRHAGTGSAVLSRLTDDADAVGAEVSLRVDRGSRARQLYERWGFAVVAEDSIQHVMKREARA